MLETRGGYMRNAPQGRVKILSGRMWGRKNGATNCRQLLIHSVKPCQSSRNRLFRRDVREEEGRDDDPGFLPIRGTWSKARTPLLDRILGWTDLPLWNALKWAVCSSVGSDNHLCRCIRYFFLAWMSIYSPSLTIARWRSLSCRSTIVYILSTKSGTVCISMNNMLEKKVHALTMIQHF